MINSEDRSFRQKQDLLHMNCHFPNIRSSKSYRLTIPLQFQQFPIWNRFFHNIWFWIIKSQIHLESDASTVTLSRFTEPMYSITFSCFFCLISSKHSRALKKRGGGFFTQVVSQIKCSKQKLQTLSSFDWTLVIVCERRFEQSESR